MKSPLTFKYIIESSIERNYKEMSRVIQEAYRHPFTPDREMQLVMMLDLIERRIENLHKIANNMYAKEYEKRNA